MPEQSQRSPSATDLALEREKIALEREMLVLERERMNAEREQWKIESGWQKKAASGLQVSVTVLGFAMAGMLVLGIVAGYSRSTFEKGFEAGSQKERAKTPQHVRVSKSFLELLERAPLALETPPPETLPSPPPFDFFEGYRRPQNLQRVNTTIWTR